MAGTTWKQIQKIDFGTRLRTVKFRNHAEAWGIDAGGTMLITQNQGKDWKWLHASFRDETENSEAESWVDRMAKERSEPVLNPNHQRAFPTRWARMGCRRGKDL